VENLLQVHSGHTLTPGVAAEFLSKPKSSPLQFPKRASTYSGKGVNKAWANHLSNIWPPDLHYSCVDRYAFDIVMRLKGSATIESEMKLSGKVIHHGMNSMKNMYIVGLNEAMTSGIVPPSEANIFVFVFV